MGKNGKNSQRRPKRVCVDAAVDRFGATENSIDHNSFFENLISTEPELEAENMRLDTGMKPNSDTQMNTDRLLKLILSKINVMQQQLIKLEVKIDNIPNQEIHEAKRVIDMVKLNNLGLPVKTGTQLDSLEANLKEEIKRNEIVSIFH